MKLGKAVLTTYPTTEAMGTFRLFQPFSEEYMFVWNSLVAVHTLEQLSEDKQQEVIEHYHHIVAINVTDPTHDIAAMSPVDPFWLSLTLGDLGVPPLLGPKSAKWFYVPHPRRARFLMTKRSQALFEEVLRDILVKYRVRLNLPE